MLALWADLWVSTSKLQFYLEAQRGMQLLGAPHAILQTELGY